MSAPAGDGGTTLRRRRALELALERRPDMTVGDLLRVLAALDMPVDTATLVDDLDALGFDVAGAEPAPDDVDPEAVAAAVDATSSAPAAPPVALPFWRTRIGVALLAGALLVASLAVAAGLASRDDPDAEATDALDALVDTGAPPPTSAAATTTAPGPSAAPATAPVGPGSDPALDAGVDGASDFASGSDGDLGPAPDGGPWNVLAGSWSVVDGVARLDAVEGDAGVGLAVFDPGADAYRLQVDLASLVTANGLVFGVVDAGTYHAVVSAPDFSTFVLVRVVDGRREVVGDSDLTTTPPDRAVVGVHVTPDAIEVLVQGAVVLTQPLEAPLPATAMGIGSAPGGAGGTFDAVAYLVEAAG